MKHTTKTWIEREWEGIALKYASYRKMDNITNEQKCLLFMHYTKPTQHWFMSYEFIGPKHIPVVGHMFLSHRGPARITGLLTKYPSLIEKREIHGLAAYRIRYENLQDILESDMLPEKLYKTVKQIAF